MGLRRKTQILPGLETYMIVQCEIVYVLYGCSAPQAWRPERTDSHVPGELVGLFWPCKQGREERRVQVTA